jgi:hypothetical protein
VTALPDGSSYPEINFGNGLETLLLVEEDLCFRISSLIPGTGILFIPAVLALPEVTTKRTRVAKILPLLKEPCRGSYCARLVNPLKLVEAVFRFHLRWRCWYVSGDAARVQPKVTPANGSGSAVGNSGVFELLRFWRRFHQRKWRW